MHKLIFKMSPDGDSYITEVDENNNKIAVHGADYGTICGYFEILKKQPYAIQQSINTLEKLFDFADDY